MPGARGIAREVCGIRERGFCPFNGCVPGTGPKAMEKLQKFKAAMGHSCSTLACAIKNEVDYYTRCDRFRCDVHYKQGGPYSKQTLDMLKGVLGKK